MNLRRRVEDFLYWRARRMIHRLRYLLDNVEGYLAPFELRYAEHDPRIRYPCYKSLDEHIDVERLRALDATLERQVRAACAKLELENFDAGNTKAKLLGKRKGESLVIPLTSTGREFSYFDLDRPELWHPTEHVKEFPELWSFVQTLPFRSISRVSIFADPDGNEVAMHRDHTYTDRLHEFVWFRTNCESKPFYLAECTGGERCYIEGYSAWFDTVNQLHGCERSGTLAISVRVDGEFTEAFRALFPSPRSNAASTPSLWASLEQGR